MNIRSHEKNEWNAKPEDEDNFTTETQRSTRVLASLQTAARESQSFCSPDFAGAADSDRYSPAGPGRGVQGVARVRVEILQSSLNSVTSVSLW